MISPHLPPQPVMFSIGSSARATCGAASALRPSEALSARKRRRCTAFGVSVMARCFPLQFHVGAQADGAVEREDDEKGEQDRYDRRRADRAVEVELQIVEQRDR